MAAHAGPEPTPPGSADTRLVVFGEALVDVIPTGARTWEGTPGGAPANVAVAAARLGMPTQFVGGLSTDRWGHVLADHLAASGVDVTAAPRAAAPTALAVVELDDDGTASYRFLWDGTADRAVTVDQLPEVSDATWLQVGSAAAAFADSGAAAAAWVARERAHVLVSCDPNVRVGVHGDSEAVRTRLLDLADQADVVKTSDEDLGFLLPNTSIPDAIHRWLDNGAGMVAVTRGSRGAVLGCRDGIVQIPPVVVEVADTVAAGDTFMAALLVGLSDSGVTGRDGLAALDTATLEAVGHMAAGTAAITVSRSGANPPHRHDLAPSLLLGT